MIPIYEADRLEDLPLFDRPPGGGGCGCGGGRHSGGRPHPGDEALRDYTRRFDGADLERFEVTAEEAARRLGLCGREFPGRRCGRRRTISGTSMRHRSTGTSA